MQGKNQDDLQNQANQRAETVPIYQGIQRSVGEEMKAQEDMKQSQGIDIPYQSLLGERTEIEFDKNFADLLDKNQ